MDSRRTLPPPAAGVRLRDWLDADLPAFAEMNADAEVMHHFPAPLSPAASADLLARIRAGIDERGWGLWAVEVDGRFAGLTGLSIPRFAIPPPPDAPAGAYADPAVEIAWRLQRTFWGRGIATTAASLAITFAWDSLRLPDLVSFTATGNTRSRRLMERLGFTHDRAGDFDHPLHPPGHRLSRHVLYRLRNPHGTPLQPPAA